MLNFETAWKLKGRMSLLMSIVLSIPFNSLSIPFVSLLKSLFWLILFLFHAPHEHDGNEDAHGERESGIY